MEDCFQLFDVNKNGKLGVEELSQVFGEHNIEIENLERIVELVDDDDDGTIDYRELAAAVTPATANRLRSAPMYGLSMEARKIFQQAWMESLAALFGLILSVDAEIEDKRQQLQLDAERIFDQIDAHRLGYLSLNVLTNWVSDNCGFNIRNEDLLSLQRSLDRNNDYRIEREEFIKSVAPFAEEQEEEGQEE